MEQSDVNSHENKELDYEHIIFEGSHVDDEHEETNDNVLLITPNYYLLYAPSVYLIYIMLELVCLSVGSSVRPSQNEIIITREILGQI